MFKLCAANVPCTFRNVHIIALCVIIVCACVRACVGACVRACAYMDTCLHAYTFVLMCLQDSIVGVL